MAKHGIERVAVSEIYADFDRNFRDPILEYADCEPTASYDHQEYLKGNAKQGFFEDIFYNGVTTPVWVSAMSVDQIETVFQKTGKRYSKRVIRGHRRIYTVNRVNTLFPGHITEIDCDVYEGLSVEQEWELMADHSPTKREQPLSELGMYHAVINLYGAGFSQEKIGNLLGQKRGWAMRRIWLHQMGTNTPIEADFVASFDPKREKGTYVSIPMSKVDELHKAYSEDTDASREPMADGSHFLAKYESFKETGNPSKPEPKSQTRKTILERQSYVKGRPALEEAMKFASNDGGNLADAAKMYDKLSEKAKLSETLATERDALVAERDALVAERDALVAERDALVARVNEFLALDAERDALVAERDTLRAELDATRKSRVAAKK